MPIIFSNPAIKTDIRIDRRNVARTHAAQGVDAEVLKCAALRVRNEFIEGVRRYAAQDRIKLRECDGYDQIADKGFGQHAAGDQRNRIEAVKYQSCPISEKAVLSDWVVS